MKRILVIFLSLFIFSSFVFATGPAFQKIAFQGYLTDDNGDALSGTYALTLTIYDALTDGNALFTETHSSVAVTSGVFDLLIGDVSQIADDSIFNGAIQYLGIKVDGGTELSPRTPLVAVPYAFTASKVTGESVWVKNEGAQDLPIYAQNTQGIAIYARGGSAATVIGSSEASSGYGLEGHAYGDSGAGVYGRAHTTTGWGVTAVNTTATDGNMSGGALSVTGKIKIDTGNSYSCAGSGTIPNGNARDAILNDNVTNNSMIFLTVYSADAISQGGIRVGSITAATGFTVETMNQVVADNDIDFWYLIIN